MRSYVSQIMHGRVTRLDAMPAGVLSAHVHVDALGRERGVRALHHVGHPGSVVRDAEYRLTLNVPIESCQASTLTAMVSPHPWPTLREEDRWLIDRMEERLGKTHKTEQLRAHAQELRAEAAETDMHGYREAALALADRYEQAAATRTSAR